MRFRWAYPSNWPELARACKEQAGWRCEDCGVAHGSQAVSHRSGVVYTVHLAAAHLDHDIWNPQPRLRALCPRCHARYDASQRERQRRVQLERQRHQWLLRRVFVSWFTGRSHQRLRLSGSALVYVCDGWSSCYACAGQVSTFSQLSDLVLSLAAGTDFEVQLWFGSQHVGTGWYRRLSSGIAVRSEDAMAAGLFQAVQQVASTP